MKLHLLKVIYNLFLEVLKLIEKDLMKDTPYASVVGSSMYPQICNHPDIVYAIGLLSKFLSNLGVINWKAIEKVM